LHLVNERQSIEEMAEDCNISVGWVHQRLEVLQDQGLVVPPPKPNQARARRLSKWGETYLQEAGYAKVKLWDEDQFS
jgi:predicted transcriptional regulator